MTDHDAQSQEADELIHQFRNHLGIVIGFCDLLLADAAVDARSRADVATVRDAGEAALALLPDLVRLRSDGAGR